MDEPLPPGLHIVATPIGNLGDLSPRAADVLRRADRILAEDTRVTGKLLAHIGSKVPMRRYDDHSSDDERRADRRAARRRSGGACERRRDAADFRSRVQAGARCPRRRSCHRHPPRPLRRIAALTLAGLPTDRFLFVGFLPAKAKARADAIARCAQFRATLVFYESGPRLGETLAALDEGLGNREAAVAREISKLHEECVTGSLPSLPSATPASPRRAKS